MRTVRRLFVVYCVPCLLAVALSVTPAAAQTVADVFAPIDRLHPLLGTITDDPGPFNRFRWAPDNEVNHFYVPSDDDGLQEASVAADRPTVKFNPVSGYPVAVWTIGDGGNGIAPRQAVLFSHFAVGGWTRPTTLAESARDPSLSIDPVSGQVHLVYWTSHDGGTVWHRHAPADLTSWSDAVRVSDIREQAARPTALVHGDTLQIAYERHVAGLGSTPREIVVAASGAEDRLTTEPSTEPTTEPMFSRTVLAMTDYAGRNWVRLDSDGRRLLVRWLNAEHQAGWVLQGEYGVWGPVGLQPMLPVESVAPVRGNRQARPGR